MDDIKIPEGAHAPEEWDSWSGLTRQLLEQATHWAKNREKWEALGGIAAQPINYPHYEDEMVVFPRMKRLRFYFDLVKDPKLRTRWYKIKLQELSANIRREDRGTYTFLLTPPSFDRIDLQLSTRPGENTEEIRRVLRELYYKGKRPEEVDSKVSRKTLGRALTEAEAALDILRDFREDLKISLKTLEVSYTAMRYGRDAKIDIRRYFYPRIF